MATSAKKNQTGTGAVTPSLGNGSVTGNPPAGKNGTYKDHYQAPQVAAGGTGAAAPKAPARKTGAGPAGGAADKAVDPAGATLGGAKKKTKRFSSIKELRDYANKQGYSN